MGRIDEALRRVDTLPAADAAPRRRHQTAAETFASPWSFREGESVVGKSGIVQNPLSAALDGSSELQRHDREFNSVWIPRLVIAEKANRSMVEEFRQLAATLHQAQVVSNVRVLMITSAEPGEGKSTTAVNLALTLSESYKRRVLLLDADLRRPSLHEITNVPNAVGLGETLKATGDFKLPLFQLSDTLMLAPAGRPDASPMGALTSPRMHQLLVEASHRFEWVIIDAPPIGVIADASLLAPLSDGVLLVVRARRTHYGSAQKAIEAIGRDRVLGVVLNDAEVEDAPAYERYYYADQAGSAESTTRRP